MNTEAVKPGQLTLVWEIYEHIPHGDILGVSDNLSDVVVTGSPLFILHAGESREVNPRYITVIFSALDGALEQTILPMVIPNPPASIKIDIDCDPIDISPLSHVPRLRETVAGKVVHLARLNNLLQLLQAQPEGVGYTDMMASLSWGCPPPFALPDVTITSEFEMKSVTAAVRFKQETELWELIPVVERSIAKLSEQVASLENSYTLVVQRFRELEHLYISD